VVILYYLNPITPTEKTPTNGFFTLLRVIFVLHFAITIGCCNLICNEFCKRLVFINLSMGRTAPKVAAGGLFVAQLEHGAHHHTHHRRREERLPQQRVAPPVPLITTAQYPTPGQREGDPEGWSTVLVTALGSWEKHREGDPKG
jgi:hypothetical protein